MSHSINNPAASIDGKDLVTGMKVLKRASDIARGKIYPGINADRLEAILSLPRHEREDALIEAALEVFKGREQSS